MKVAAQAESTPVVSDRFPRAFSIWVLCSVVLHMLLVLGLPGIHSRELQRPPMEATDVTFVVTEAEPPEEVEIDSEPSAPVEPPAQVKPRVSRQPNPSADTSPLQNSDAKPTDTPPQEAPVSFDNVTLSNDTGDSSWASAVGSGRDSDQPIGAPGTPTGRSAPGSLGQGGGGAAKGPPLVGLGNLSNRPKPLTSLDSLLQKNYPRIARLQGVEGKVVASVKILPNGKVGSVRVRSESVKGYKFADACRRTLRASRWSSPTDKTGRPVATQISFSCTFQTE